MENPTLAPAAPVFLFGDKVRLQYVWESPNLAAAALVSLYPFCWLVVDRLSRRYWTQRPFLSGAVRHLVDLALIWLVTITHSRGGIIALITVIGARHLFNSRTARPDAEPPVISTLIRV